MQSWRGNAAPRLAMDFEVGGGRWRIEKRFLHQPMANLTAPDGGRFDGDAAEEELQRLLGFGAAGKRGSGPDQMGVWGALWVTQRDSVLQADLSSNLARATVTSCLDAEVGVLTGSEKGQALMRIVRDQLGQLLDGNSRPRGRYRQVMTAIGDGDAKLAELRDRAKRLSEDSDALRDRAGKLARESDVAAERRDLAALDDARRRKEAALVHQQRLDAATSAHALAERNWEDAEHERLARATRAEATLRIADVLAQAVETAKLARQSVEEAGGTVSSAPHCGGCSAEACRDLGTSGAPDARSGGDCSASGHSCRVRVCRRASGLSAKPGQRFDRAFGSDANQQG